MRKQQKGELMGKYSKKVSPQRKILTAVCGVLGVVLAVLIVMLIGMNRDTAPEEQIPGTTAGSVPTTTAAAEPKMKELLVESVTEEGAAVFVKTTYGMVQYPYAFSDLISVEAATFEDYAVLDFCATLEDTAVKLYTLMFNTGEGIPVGTLLVDGETFVVTAQFHDAIGIGNDSMVTFYAVQETFNDVVNSLSENEGFTAAD